MFGKKPTVFGNFYFSLIENVFEFNFLFIEQTKSSNRELKKTDRELVRDRQKLEIEEQRLVRVHSRKFQNKNRFP